MKKLTYLLILTVLILPACSKTSDENKNIDSTPIEREEINNDSEENSEEIESESSEEKEKIVNKEDCDKVTIGMTPEEVRNLLGEPISTIDSTTADQQMENWSYQKGVYFGPNCSITFIDGKVFTKQFFNLQNN